MTIDVVCPETGEVRSTQLFVAALGASNYTYVEATWSQKVSDWISSHARAFTIQMCFRGIHQGQRNVSWVISLGLLIATNMAATQPDDRISVS